MHDRALSQVTSLRSNIEADQLNLKEKEKNLRKHKIEWHHKIVLSLACLVLFLIGAPLGSIIRKGGLGTPLIFAIIFFMVFYFSTTVGEKFANENTLTPFAGMWLATFLLVPIGIFLTYKAMRDSQLFNKEWYYRFAKTVGSIHSSFFKMDACKEGLTLLSLNFFYEKTYNFTQSLSYQFCKSYFGHNGWYCCKRFNDGSMWITEGYWPVQNLIPVLHKSLCLILTMHWIKLLMQ